MAGLQARPVACTACHAAGGLCWRGAPAHGSRISGCKAAAGIRQGKGPLGAPACAPPSSSTAATNTSCSPVSHRTYCLAGPKKAESAGGRAARCRAGAAWWPLLHVHLGMHSGLRTPAGAAERRLGRLSDARSSGSPMRACVTWGGLAGPPPPSGAPSIASAPRRKRRSKGELLHRGLACLQAW